MEYLKLFENHTQYENFVSGGGGDSEYIKPNVSHCIEENHVHYNPKDIKCLTILNHSYDYHEYMTEISFISSRPIGTITESKLYVYDDNDELTSTKDVFTYQSSNNTTVYYFDGYLRNSYVVLSLTNSEGITMISDKYYIDTQIFE